MRAKINPTGTHVKSGFLKVRVDLYPDPADKTYALHYVEHFDREPTEEELADPEKLARVPAHRELNPCLCHFITVTEDITVDQLLAYVEQLFTPDCLATLDDALVKPDAIHYVSPYMRSRPKMAAHVIRGKTEDVVAAVNERLSGLEFVGDKGRSESIEPESIDVGDAAINRSSSTSYASYTLVSKGNPANASGTLDTVQVYLYHDHDAPNFYVGSFGASGNHLTCRDSESLGAVTSGSLQTISGLNIGIESGDYIGGHDKGGVAFAERDSTGGSGAWQISGEYIDPSDEGDYTFNAGYAISLYATGAEGGGVTEKTSAETGAGVESVFGRGMARGETGSGLEGELARVALLAGDAGQGTEYAHILGLWETLFGQDVGRGSDSLKAVAVRGGHETGLRAGPGRVGIPHKEVKL